MSVIMFVNNKYWMAGLLFSFLLPVFACNNNTETDNISTEKAPPAVTQKSIPAFDERNTYTFIQEQLNFGPRVPGTQEHKKCADWLNVTLSSYSDTVFLQSVEVKAGNGTMLPCYNIIGSFRPEAEKRILLLAHWDTRPWADQDISNTETPILGADDGASGVAVLLQLAKTFKENPLPEGLGIDILLTDVEDYGKSEWGDDSYALGTRYWANNPHVAGYKAQAGILLDMVGAKNARFPLEGYSAKYAPAVQNAVWRAASDAGYSSYFVYQNGGHITDDHVPVNEILKIPTIDIINLPTASKTGFGHHWHTHQDNIDIIDVNTLKAVGQTVLQYIYNR